MPESDRPSIRAVGVADRPWVAAFFEARGMTTVARRGELVRPLDHPMLIAVVGRTPVGVVDLVGGDACEILTLHVVDQWRGIGTALVELVRVSARAAGCSSMWVLTTNDNVDALPLLPASRVPDPGDHASAPSTRPGAA